MRLGRYIIRLLILAFILISVPNTYSQNDKISESKYKELRQEVTFDKTTKALRPKPPKEKKKEVEEIDFPDYDINWYDALAGFEILAYIAIFLIGCLLLYFIFSNLDNDKKIDPKKDTDYIEDIEEVDTEDGYATALREGDYRSAIRMHFLKILQMLARKNTINWQPEKTNRDYTREILDAPKRSAFKNVARIYENVWYGNHSIDRRQFEELDFHFHKFIKNES
jgi:hypothetical protein